MVEVNERPWPDSRDAVWETVLLGDRLEISTCSEKGQVWCVGDGHQPQKPQRSLLECGHILFHRGWEGNTMYSTMYQRENSL